MAWRVWRLTALYVASCSVLIVSTIGLDRARGFVRNYGGRAAAAARTVPVPDVSIPGPSTAARAAANQDHGKRPASRLREYQVPIGSVLSARLRTPIDSGSSRVNDQVDATLAEPVSQDGVELIPAGSLLHGTIVDVVPASPKTILGQVTIAFAAVQHAETRSRAAIRTRKLTIEAQPPENPPDGRRRPKRQPTDLVLPAGHPLLLTLDDPLVVFIPKEAPRRQSPSATP